MQSLRSFLLAVPLAVCLGASDGQAEMPPVADSQQDLQHRLDALGTHFHGGSLARWSNHDDQKVLKDLWDPSLLGSPPYSMKDVSALVTMLKAQASILRLYTTAGKAIPGSEKEARVRTKYQDEIVRSSAFLVATSAALLQAMGEFGRHNETIATLERLRAFLPDDATIIPGHGRPMRPADVAFPIRYLRELDSIVRKAVEEDLSVEATLEAAAMARYGEYSLFDWAHRTVNVPATHRDLQVMGKAVV